MRRRSGKLKRRSCLCLSWFGPRCPSAPAWRPTAPPSRWTTSGARPCRPSQSLSSKSLWVPASVGVILEMLSASFAFSHPFVVRTQASIS